MGEKKETKKIVFYISLIIIAVMAVWSVAFNDSFTAVSNAAFAFFTTDFGWLYLLAMIVFLVFIVFIAFSKFGKIRLGGDDSKPEYSNMTWFGLLFGCGMGVGLVFWGVAEPLNHYLNPQGMEGATAESADFAMKSFFTHWGILPWANYAIIGLALAYFMFRKNKKGLISSILEPLIGEKLANGWLGKLIDILAVFATVAGIVTSLGLGTMQINAGFNRLFGLPVNLTVQIAIIAIVSVIYITSAVSGIEKGIKIISDANLYVAIGLMAVCFLVGPKIEILNSFVNGMGQYIGDFIPDALRVSTYGDNSWLGSWRLFYWAWFIAWAPFVGVFIARISKGRTIKEFVMGVVLVPAMASCIWGAVFGNLGINLAEKGILAVEELQQVVANPEVGLFMVLQEYPLGFVLSIIAIVSLCAFFITSANSGVYVLSMLTTDGNINPPNSKKILWGIIQSVMAIGLLMAGGLKPLQTISLAAAFPFIFIMFAACAALYKTLKKEKV
ncbi:BCCT family transporter [Bariatricus massiliensis]|uniref:BCCT family transporter n=1 Tax=Bariatricus massiliensis TaxID=1745713 RepID=A0ABS8DE81_9FIRM|nr:BCCT family transporter [Bariatricus massiliensis]MCB7302840.1 BCCT family transporter [Bariatricus massiliensis]MCB7374056.1 BCCT family transporter [Bariatricus massiliensis]MCB7386726.1 BCCT family transporter [Bariatricus massiliensis]MCB7410888.1 BCCT family transporter [Bariatricus massiliensis]MCQ5251712.1 BCCT family transporter [Bariatricus massiliensis]